MNKTIELEEFGSWHLPGQQSAPEAFGRLRWDQFEGATLTLFAELPMLPMDRASPAILGESLDGKRFTLLDAVPRQHVLHGGTGRVELTLQAQRLLRGAHAESSDAFRFDTAVVSLRGLRELMSTPWPTKTGISEFLDYAEQDRPAERRVAVNGAELVFHSSWGGAVERHRQLREREARVGIKLDQSLSLAVFDETWVQPLLALVTFASREPTTVEAWTAVIEDDTCPDPGPAIRRVPLEAWRRQDVEILQRRRQLTAEPAFDYQRPLLPFAAVTDQFDDVITRWWDLYSKLGTATSFLISALGSRMFLENQLLNLTSFAESYHRVCHDEPPVATEDHERFVTTMLEALPTKREREHYGVRLKRARSQSQRQRLQWLLDRAAKIILPLQAHRRTLVGRLVDTRNHFVHLDDTGPTPASGSELLKIVKLLEVSIQTNLLLDLGLEDEFVNTLVLTSYQSQWPLSSP